MYSVRDAIGSAPREDGILPDREMESGRRGKLDALVDAEKLKLGKCELCHYTNDDCIFLFDYDHIDPKTKIAAISEMIRLGYSWSEIKAEIQKCRLLCCNCHRIHTSTQGERPWLVLEDFTDEEKAKAKIYMFGTPEEIMELQLKRPVVPVRPVSLEVVAIYVSVAQATREVKGTDSSSIVKCLNGLYESHNKSLWRDPTPEEMKLVSDGKGTWKNPDLKAYTVDPAFFGIGYKKAIVQMLPTKEIVAIYPTLSQAALAVDGAVGSLTELLQGKRKHHKKYLWRHPTTAELELIKNGKVWKNPKLTIQTRVVTQLKRGTKNVLAVFASVVRAHINAISANVSLGS